MFNYTTKILLALSVLVFGGLTAANGQMSNETIVKVNVPYAFVLRDQTYPAGDYTIKAADNAASSLRVLALRSYDTKTSAFFGTLEITAGKASNNSELVFDKVGDKYFLSKIWVNGEAYGFEIEKSKLEKELTGADKPSADIPAAEITITN